MIDVPLYLDREKPDPERDNITPALAQLQKQLSEGKIPKEAIEKLCNDLKLDEPMYADYKKAITNAHRDCLISDAEFKIFHDVWLGSNLEHYNTQPAEIKYLTAKFIYQYIGIV